MASKKEISFDLNTNALKEYFVSYTRAYKDLSKALQEVGFIHRQGSVYNSIKGMTNMEAVLAIQEACLKLPWLSECIKEIDVTSITRTHSLLDEVKDACKPLEEERKKMKNHVKVKRGEREI